MRCAYDAGGEGALTLSQIEAAVKLRDGARAEYAFAAAVPALATLRAALLSPPPATAAAAAAAATADAAASAAAATDPAPPPPPPPPTLPDDPWVCCDVARSLAEQMVPLTLGRTITSSPSPNPNPNSSPNPNPNPNPNPSQVPLLEAYATTPAAAYVQALPSFLRSSDAGAHLAKAIF